MTRHYLVPVLGALTLAMAAPAAAQWGRPDARYGSSSEVTRVAYDRGYTEGVKEGEKDGRGRDAFDYQDERDYQRADVGYNNRYGSASRYRDVFRQGFAAGYTEGYRRFSPRGYGYGSGNGSYRNRGYGAYGGDGYPPYAQGRDERYLAPFEIGARDGFDKGVEDVRDNDRYDPRRHKWYREGDHDYNNRYGSRDLYKDEYRRGFLVGYERGYREGRYR